MIQRTEKFISEFRYGGRGSGSSPDLSQLVVASFSTPYSLNGLAGLRNAFVSSFALSKWTLSSHVRTLHL
jgi:hypothetical protein